MPDHGLPSTLRDPVDVAEEFIAAALVGGEWECRDNYPATDRQVWVERGTKAGGDLERFIEPPLSDLDGCKVEELLLVARGYRDALVAIAEGAECSIGLKVVSKHGDTFCAYHVARSALEAHG